MWGRSRDPAVPSHTGGFPWDHLGAGWGLLSASEPPPAAMGINQHLPPARSSLPARRSCCPQNPLTVFSPMGRAHGPSWHPAALPGRSTAAAPSTAPRPHPKAWGAPGWLVPWQAVWVGAQALATAGPREAAPLDPSCCLRGGFSGFLGGLLCVLVPMS